MPPRHAVHLGQQRFDGHGVNFFSLSLSLSFDLHLGRDFGRDFVISVPNVMTNEGGKYQPPANARSFVIPINWRSHSAKLIVCLE